MIEVFRSFSRVKAAIPLQKNMHHYQMKRAGTHRYAVLALVLLLFGVPGLFLDVNTYPLIYYSI